MVAKSKLPSDPRTGQITFIDPKLLADIHDGATTAAHALPLIWKRIANLALDESNPLKLREMIEAGRYLSSEVVGPYVEIAAKSAGHENPFKVDEQKVLERFGVEYLQRLRSFLATMQAPDDLVAPLPSPEEEAPPEPRNGHLVEGQSSD